MGTVECKKRAEEANGVKMLYLSKAEKATKQSAMRQEVETIVSEEVTRAE